MKPRRTNFAAPFVMVVAAGCGGGSHEPIHANPPGGNPPEPRMSADQCRAQSEGAPCDGAFTSCSIQSEDGCGLQGYECIKADDGKQTWHAYMNLCNPPPPGNELVPNAPDTAPKP
ncbi:MAG TPA: hypothetical protein VGM90_06485 [Kofleriaceae bacterium]|jgi:hypothetical protein